jgi:hypothetical protein
MQRTLVSILGTIHTRINAHVRDAYAEHAHCCGFRASTASLLIAPPRHCRLHHMRYTVITEVQF